MTYCMADIHGARDAFWAMLRKIRFSESDTLYIIGDVIDRGPDGIPLLREILAAPNIHLLLGNHEQMCVDTMGRSHKVGAKALWLCNGGGPTYAALMYGCTPRERRELLDAMADLPDHMDIEVVGRPFHLVHGFPGNNTHDRIWERPLASSPAPLPGRIVILGHTPTCFLTGNRETPCSIWYGNGIIDIDCGCGDTGPTARLACLRLEDMAEFYIKT